MKYCLPYQPNAKYSNSVEELEIIFNNADSSLPQFLDEHKNQTIVISAVLKALNKEDFTLLSALNKKYKNIKVKIDYDVQKARCLKMEKIPYFFYNFISDWESLTNILEFEPCDVCIEGELCFDLPNVSDYCHKRSYAIRVVPNLCYSRYNFSNKAKINSFFIRPEDGEYYDKYIDTFEFVGQQKQLSTYYKIYSKDKKWRGPLNEIIIGLDTAAKSCNIGPEFARSRCSCGQSCKKGNSYQKCKMCFEIEKLAINYENKIKPNLKN